MYLLSAYVSTLEFAATIQDGVLGLREAAANFLFSMHQYGLSFPLSDGVSGVHKITRYNDEGLNAEKTV